jgi:D-glycero-D-manno-heptose 1,7-bisphosphate phosphatase
VFFDRDGVLTELVWNQRTQDRESPHSVKDLRLRRHALRALSALQSRGYELFLVSNQPSYAKGKASLEDLRAVASSFATRVGRGGVRFRAAYYCFHHPKGVVAPYARRCRCRKPSPYFLRLAARRYGIDLKRSWMVGDRDTDIECGRRAGCRTLLMTSRAARAAVKPPADDAAGDLDSALRLIIGGDRRGR